MAFLYGALGLLDGTIRAMLGVPVLAFFLVGLLMFAALGLARALKNAAQSGSGRR